jgi:pimeloyl-ACP methyl ester carboxylesterase
MRKSAFYRGEAISFLDSGKGRVVVLVHGFLGSAALWEPICRNLSRTYRVIAIDLPGHGQTPCIGYAHSMEMMAEAVKSVLDSLHLRKVVLVGHSMGGYVTLAFAEKYPDYLRGFCLFHSTSYPDSEEKKKDRLRAIAAVKTNKNIFTKNFIRHLFAAKNLKYLKKEISFASAIARSTSQKGVLAALYGMRARTRRDMLLWMVKYPVMMIIGEHDERMPPEALKEESQLIKNKTVLVLEHDGHFGFLESPLLVNRELRKFVRKCYLHR